jgi:hypothetical protein
MEDMAQRAMQSRLNALDHACGALPEWQTRPVYHPFLTDDEEAGLQYVDQCRASRAWSVNCVTSARGKLLVID